MDHLSDEEDEYDPDEPMMEGSDDEFSDLEMDERDDDVYEPVDTDTASSLAALPGSSSLSSAQPSSPTHSSTLSNPGSPPQSPPPSDTPSSASSSPGKYTNIFVLTNLAQIIFLNVCSTFRNIQHSIRLLSLPSTKIFSTSCYRVSNNY